ncbi:unnamed protein product [Pleuronectes platessa]|uniref:Uncharacterized protein n=1 Tax=Pleuronectes platessa TaxID=8262 RepID=A0A9N7TKV9_PLEPL|nr:unnamed protein product [Pleuronectes platessa]
MKNRARGRECDPFTIYVHHNHPMGHIDRSLQIHKPRKRGTWLFHLYAGCGGSPENVKDMLNYAKEASAFCLVATNSPSAGTLAQFMTLHIQRRAALSRGRRFNSH